MSHVSYELFHIPRYSVGMTFYFSFFWCTDLLISFFFWLLPFFYFHFDFFFFLIVVLTCLTWSLVGICESVAVWCEQFDFEPSLTDSFYFGLRIMSFTLFWGWDVFFNLIYFIFLMLLIFCLRKTVAFFGFSWIPTHYIGGENVFFCFVWLVG